VTEVCCHFGLRGGLSGIITEPGSPARRVGLVLVSAGLSAKRGPFRLYAELARRVARDGVRTLRFDLGGLGDSRSEYTGHLLEERTRLEIKAAVDHLVGSHGLDDVVLGGLCSGAEDSLRAAESDTRVKGVVLVDPFAYRTGGWLWRHVLYRATRRLLRALGLHRPLVRVPVGSQGARSLVTYRFMDRAESGRILRTLVGRGTHVHFVYTGGARELFNHPRQLQAMFGDVTFDGRVTLDHLPHAGHTQLLESDRRSIVETIARRLASTHEGTRIAPAFPHSSSKENQQDDYPD
jgi:pimeloyl-ACP methyl ester carboxylesterase